MAGAKKLGLVWVMASALVTGTLWFNRPNPAILIEDVAIPWSALIERQAYAYAEGTNAVVIPSNTVHIIPQWSTVYGVMDAARAMATNTAGNVLWLDPDTDLADGDYLVSGAQNWQVVSTQHVAYLSTSGAATQTIYRWGVSGVTGLVDEAASTATLRHESGKWYWPEMETNRTPFARQFFGRDGGHGTDYGNFWTSVGNGTSVYKYASEILRNFNDETITVAALFQYGMRLDGPTNLVFPYASTASRSVSIAQRGIGFTGHSVGLYSVSGYNRDTAYFLASDNTFPVNHIVNKTRLYLTEGASDTFTARLPSPISGTRITTITATGSPVTIEPTSLTFNSGNWSTPQTVTITALTDSDSEPGGAVIKLTDSGVFDSYLVVSIADTGAANFSINPAVVTMNKTQSGTASVSLGIPQTNGYVVANQIIKTQDLQQAWNVLKSLNRTIAFYPHTALTYSNSTEYTASVLTSRTEFASGSWLADDSSDIYASAAAELLESSDSAPASTFWDGLGELGYYRIGSKAFRSLYDPSGDPLAYRSTTASGIRRSTLLQNCTLPYPSSAAMASGMVTRIRVYAAAYAASGLELLPSINSPGLTNTAYTGSYAPSDDDLGLALVPGTTQPPNLSISAETAYVSDSSTDGPIRLTLIGSWENPDSPPVFDLGSDTITPNDNPRAVEAEWVTAETGTRIPYFERLTQLRYEASVRIRGFVIVADWNWGYAN